MTLILVSLVLKQLKSHFLCSRENHHTTLRVKFLSPSRAWDVSLTGHSCPPHIWSEPMSILDTPNPWCQIETRPHNQSHNDSQFILKYCLHNYHIHVFYMFLATITCPLIIDNILQWR